MKDPERTSYLNNAKKFLSTPAGIALTLLCAAVFITGIVYLITTTKILYVGWNILHAPTMLLLNILPVLLALLLFFFLTRKIGFSCSLVGIVLIFFAVVDRVKGLPDPDEENKEQEAAQNDETSAADPLLRNATDQPADTNESSEYTAPDDNTLNN